MSDAPREIPAHAEPAEVVRPEVPPLEGWEAYRCDDEGWYSVGLTPSKESALARALDAMNEPIATSAVRITERRPVAEVDVSGCPDGLDPREWAARGPVARLTRERDDARAEAERLRALLREVARSPADADRGARVSRATWEACAIEASKASAVTDGATGSGAPEARCPACGKRRGALEQGTPLPYCDNDFHAPTPPAGPGVAPSVAAESEYDRGWRECRQAQMACEDAESPYEAYERGFRECREAAWRISRRCAEEVDNTACVAEEAILALRPAKGGRP